MGRRRVAMIALAVPAALLAGCGDATEEYNDADVAGNNDAPAMRLSFPDGFGNVAAKCDGPNMVYSSRVTAEGRSVAVAPNDPRCAEGGEG